MLSTISSFWKIVFIFMNASVFWTVLLLVLNVRWRLISNIQHLGKAMFRVKSVMERMDDELDDCISEVKTKAVARNEELSEKIGDLNTEMTLLVQRFFSLASSIEEVHGIKIDGEETTNDTEPGGPPVTEKIFPKSVEVI